MSPAARLERAMRESNLTTIELARHAGISRAALNFIRNGKISPVAPASQKVAAVLGLRLVYMSELETIMFERYREQVARQRLEQ